MRILIQSFLCIAVFCSTVCGQGDVQYFLRVPGIEGGSKVEGYNAWIEVESFEFAAISQTISSLEGLLGVTSPELFRSASQRAARPSISSVARTHADTSESSRS